MKYREFEKALKIKYPDSNFYIKHYKDEIEVLYNNDKYINDDDFLDNVIDIGENYCTEDELWMLVTTYDLYKEIPSVELELAIESVEIKEQVAINFNALEKQKIVYKGEQKINKVNISTKIKKFVDDKISYISTDILSMINTIIFDSREEELNTNLKMNIFSYSIKSK